MIPGIVAASALLSSGPPPVQTSGLFNAAYAEPNIGLATNEVMITRWTNLNPLLASSTCSRLAVRLGTGVTAGKKLRLYLYDAAFALIGQTVEYTTTGSDSSTVIYLDLTAPLSGPALNVVNWLGVHVDSAINISVAAFSAGASGSRRGTGFPYASGAPASLSSLGGVQDHVVMVWAEETVPYGILGAWEHSAPNSFDTLEFDSAANRLACVRAITPAGTGAIRTIDRIYARLGATVTAGNKFRPVVYTDNGASPESALRPVNVIAEGVEATVGVAGQNLEMVIDAEFTEGDKIWLGIMADGATNLKSNAFGVAFGGTNRSHYQAHTYANPAPDPAAITTHELEYAGIWARYS